MEGREYVGGEGIAPAPCQDSFALEFGVEELDEAGPLDSLACKAVDVEVSSRAAA